MKTDTKHRETHPEKVKRRLAEDGYAVPEGKGKCPNCTFITDDIDAMDDHIRHDCDLAYND